MLRSCRRQSRTASCLNASVNRRRFRVPMNTSRRILAPSSVSTKPREGHGQHLNLTLRRVPRRAALHLFIDSTGLSMVGEGEWAAAKHGRRGRRGWKKLHLGVDHAGVIVAQALTDSAVDDASTGIDLIETIASSARTVTADAAYDTLAFYETANTRGTTVVVPPAKTAKLSRRNPRSSARDGTIRRISKIGRRRWKKEVGYHRQARVENAFFRYKSILGESTSTSDSRSASCRIGCLRATCSIE